MAKKYHTYAFEKLEVWQLGREMKKNIRPILLKFPKEERFGITDQLRRSVGSITTNIAEGSGRASDIDQANFINIAYASGLECIDHIITALDLCYITEAEYERLRVDFDKLLNKLNAYYKYLVNRNNNLKNSLKG